MLEKQKFVNLDINGLQNVTEAIEELIGEIQPDPETDDLTIVQKSNGRFSDGVPLFDLAVYINATDIEVAADISLGTAFNTETPFPQTV